MGSPRTPRSRPNPPQEDIKVASMVGYQVRIIDQELIEGGLDREVILPRVPVVGDIYFDDTPASDEATMIWTVRAVWFFASGPVRCYVENTT